MTFKDKGFLTKAKKIAKDLKFDLPQFVNMTGKLLQQTWS